MYLSAVVSAHMHCIKHFLQIAHKVLVILVLSGCACTTEDEVLENFKTNLQESIVAARSFRQSIAGFEYTAINIKDYSQISKHVYNLLDDVLNTKAEDFVTVLDIKMNDIASANESDFIADIFSCLESYTMNGSEIEHYVTNTQMRVHSVKRKNLQNLLAFSDYTDKIRYIHELIQHKIDTYVNDQIENSFEVCLLDLLTKTIVKNYLGKFESNNLSITDSIGVIEEITNAEILIQFVNACDNGTLGDKVFDETILHFNSDLNHIDSIISDVMNFQSNVSYIYYERIEVENFICREYDNKLIDLVNNNITIVLESLVPNLLNLTSEEFEAIYGWFIAKILQAVRSNGYSHSTHSAHIIMDAFEASNDDFELLETSNQFFLKAIRLDDGIKAYKDKNYASNFICLKPFCQKKQIKIICNDRITKMNVDHFCNILGKIGITLGTQQNSFVLINMMQGIDIYGISGYLQKFYTDEFNSCFWIDSNNIINKAITIESKKADNSFLRKSSIDFKSDNSSASFMPTSSDDLAKEIHKTIARNMTVVDGADNRTLHLIDNSEIDLVILQNLKAQERNITVSETFVIAVESDQGVNIVQVVFYIDEEGCQILDLKHNLPTTDRPDDKNCETENGLILIGYSGTNRAKAISYLSNYLKNVQMLPKDYSLPTFTCDVLDKFAVKQIKVPIYSNVAGDTDAVIASELVDITKTIANFHDTEKNTNSMPSLKIPLFNILRRKIDYGTWIKNIQTFLTDTDIDFEDFEYILDTFLIDKNLVNATNSNDMQGINVKNCDVYICAVVNKSGSKKIYIIRKDIAFDIQILPTSQLLYAFNDEMNNGIFDDDTHLIQFLRKIKQLGVNPLKCIFETILNLNYDLTDNLRKQFEANKDEFCAKFYDIINPYLYDKVPVKDDLMFEDYSNPKVLTLLNMCMTKLLEIEIGLLLDRLGQCLGKARHKPRIMITSISLGN